MISIICGLFPTSVVNSLLDFVQHLHVKAFTHNLGGMLITKTICLIFLKQYFRCLNYMRFRELEADFGSSNGQPVLETHMPIIERVAGELYTREMFLLFQPVLSRACSCTVADSRKLSLVIFIRS